MDFKIEHRFVWPADRIWAVMMSGGEEPVPMDGLKNVSECVEVERRKTDRGFFKKYNWRVDGELPRPLARIIGKEMLTFVEETEWDFQKALLKTKIIPHFFTDKITCRITRSYTPVGDTETLYLVEGFIEVRLPLIGRTIESTIVRYIIKNNAEYAGKLREFFANKFG
jgi:hypothetical protein